MFLALVLTGVATRLALQDWPNLTPVAAIALFAGYYFRSARVAMAAPLAIMLLTDLVIGFYQPLLMATVYTMLTLPIAARGVLKGVFRLDAPDARSAAASLCRLVGCSASASLAFFATTNFVCWLEGHGYSRDLAGLVSCYLQALPFFKNTLTGDVAFGLLLFGTYGALSRLNLSRKLSGLLGAKAA